MRGTCSHVSVRLLGSQTVFLGEALGSTRSPAGLVCVHTWAVCARTWRQAQGLGGHVVLGCQGICSCPLSPVTWLEVSFGGCLLPPGLRKWW